MKSNFLLLIILLSATILQAQFRFDFLTEEEGIKAIQTSTVSGGKKQVETIQTFNEAGKLATIEQPERYKKEYIYLGDTVIATIQYHGDDCKQVHEYVAQQDSNIFTLKMKYHKGRFLPENACPQYEMEIDYFRTADATEQFKNVKRNLPFKNDYDYLYIFHQKENGQYEMYFYRGSKRRSLYTLQNIETLTKEANGAMVKRVFGVQAYGQKKILLTKQLIMDDEGFPSVYLDDQTIYEGTDEVKEKYIYKKDKNGNWVEQALANPNAKQKIHRTRTITYQ